MIEAGIIDDMRRLYWFSSTKVADIKGMFGLTVAQNVNQIVGPLALPCEFCGTVLTFTTRGDIRGPLKPDGSRLVLCGRCSQGLRWVRCGMKDDHDRPLDEAFIAELREKTPKALEELRLKAEEAERKRVEAQKVWDAKQAERKAQVRERVVTITLVDDAGGTRVFTDYGQVQDVERLLHHLYVVDYLREIPYCDYLHSKHWERVRTRIIEQRKTCQLCNSKNGLHVHHRTYERRGEELDEDLVLLCNKCHAKFHDKEAH